MENHHHAHPNPARHHAADEASETLNGALRAPDSLRNQLLETTERHVGKLSLHPTRHQWGGNELLGFTHDEPRGELTILAMFPEAVGSDKHGLHKHGMQIMNVATGHNDGLETAPEQLHAVLQELRTHIGSTPIERVRVCFLDPDRLEGEQDSVEGGRLPCDLEVWGQANIDRVFDGERAFPTDLDILAVQQAPIEAILVSQTPDCTTLAGAMSADMLNHMLRECGPEVLRSNVRGSLGEHGKINSGIMQTLRNRPERMASYNNGVTINAKGMTFARIGNLVQIQRLLDPEISNGGQSSFSIREAARAGLDLSQVQLPVKILVIPEGPNRAELVRLSARYANSQNPVAKSDLSADNPTLRAAQKQFETSIFNPADPDGYKSATHWVLDCMRNEVATRERFMDEDTLRRFRRRHPVDQRLTRAELARAALAFDGKPHIIARGAEKYFSQWLADFEMKCQSGAEQLNDQWVRNTVGKHLLFCATHKAVRDSRILARSDRTIKIVAYALALVQELLAAHDLRIDFHHLANQGVVGSDLVAGFHELVQVLKDVLSQHSDGSLKEEKTWDWVKATCANIPLTEEFMNASGIVAIRANDRTFRSARKALLDRKTPPEVQGEVASIDHCDRRAVRDWISTDAAREARFGALADRWLEARIGAMALSAADSLSLLALMQTMDKAA